MGSDNVGARIRQAMEAAGLSQRSLADATGISQSTLSRTIEGQRTASVPELLRIAEATGLDLSWLAGGSRVADRVEYAARATDGSRMEKMRDALLNCIELENYLDEQFVPSPGDKRSDR